MWGGSRVSAVMVTYRTGTALFEAIDAALGQQGLDELIILDNGNPDDVIAALARLAQAETRVRLVTGHGNIGYAAACNLGARKASGDYLLFVNPDCLLPPAAVAELLEAARGFPRPSVLGGRLTNPDGSEQRGSRRATLTPWTAMVEILRLDRLAPNHPYFVRVNNHNEPPPRDPCEVPVVSGACMFMAAGDFRALGGFDEGYFVHVDDIDFCFRMRKAGGHVVFVPQVRPVHYKSTSEADPIFVEWCKTRSVMRYFRKNFADTYPGFFILATNVAVCLRFVVKVCLLGLLSLRPRRAAVAARLPLGRASEAAPKGGEPMTDEARIQPDTSAPRY